MAAAEGKTQYATDTAGIEAAAERIKPYIHETPILTSTCLNKMVGMELFFKCECFQKTGSFKIRGAMNAVKKLDADKKTKGVATHSSGNFGQALAYAAQTEGVPAYIVMPDVVIPVKKAAVEGYGGQVTLVSADQRAAVTARITDEIGATLVHPSNDPDVISGQGTIGLELIRQLKAMGVKHGDDEPLVDAVVTPLGGGGLLSGVAVAIKSFDPRIRVYGAEPAQADDAFRSKTSGSIQGFDGKVPDTIADGLRTTLGSNTWPIVRDLVDGIILVQESDIADSMAHIWERLKVVAEASSATAFAAVRTPEFQGFGHRRVALVLSGGNVDVRPFPLFQAYHK